MRGKIEETWHFKWLETSYGTGNSKTRWYREIDVKATLQILSFLKFKRYSLFFFSFCLYVCIRMGVYLCYVYVYVCLFLYAYIYVCVCVYRYVCIFACACVYDCGYNCRFSFVLMRMFMYGHIYIHVCIYVRVGCSIYVCIYVCVGCSCLCPEYTILFILLQDLFLLCVVSP